MNGMSKATDPRWLTCQELTCGASATHVLLVKLPKHTGHPLSFLDDRSVKLDVCEVHSRPVGEMRTKLPLEDYPEFGGPARYLVGVPDMLIFRDGTTFPSGVLPYDQPAEDDAS